MPDALPPVSLWFGVEDAGRVGLVTVTADAGRRGAVGAIADLAGPLGDRMSRLRARPHAFFDPPRTRRDDILIVGWIALVVASLAWALSTRRVLAQNETMTLAELTRFLIPVVLAGFVPGVAGGLFVRRGGRWYEPWLGGLLVGGLASGVVFDVWLNDQPGCSTAGGCDLASGIGATTAVVPGALVVLVGALLGRAIAFAAALVRGRRVADV